MSGQPLDLLGAEDALQLAVDRGLVDPGMAQRVRIVVQLATTLVPRVAISGQALGDALGLSRAAVHKHIDHLRSLGFAIESVAGQGYRLTAPFTDLLAGEAVLPLILQSVRPEQPWTAGLPYLYRETCDSTSRVLREAIRDKTPPSGMVVVAEHQTRGRGRLDRVWRDEVGKDLMFSILTRPSLAPGQAHLLSLAAALAVAETVETLAGFDEAVTVKWPNDVMIGGRKVCGILLEGSMDGDRLHWAITGIGLNVNSDPTAVANAIEREDGESLGARPRPASLSERLRTTVPRAPLLAELLRRLTARWTDLERPAGVASILAGLGERDSLAGHPVEVFGGGGRQQVVAAGEAVGIGPEGQLLVREASGQVVAVFSGDVSLKKGRVSGDALA